VALVPDREAQPDFWRAMEIWSLEDKVQAFPSQALALASLGQR
jgi:hypothetical protein